MSNKVNNALKGRIARLFALKSEIALKEAELEKLNKELKAEFDRMAGQNKFVNGRLELPGLAKVSVKLNPPKLIWANDAENLTPEDREGVALLLDDRFTKVDVNVPEIMKAIDRGDNKLSALLTEKGIKVVQGSRYEVKPV
ncbi:hypothetical protein DYU11_18285 [Fibrisoma montanum]|uniref:Uncharacterized protein n=1 Tax=Fibrisoma montanum TaxID=2305895 RepID=A0A418M6H1_9BACT|nr:hypothetical protein [Fibrisoma montanum]RIV21355.1 hypothetical protein DYU11_18285 [Fibrisoma montanum]